MGQKVLLIRRQSTGFDYSQQEDLDNILTLDMVRNYVSDAPTQGVELKYGQDIDVVKYINGKRHSVNPQCPVNIDLLDDFFNTQKCSLRLVRPHEFSNSLSKIMCLTDEIF